jgi:cystathionine beta-lyase
MKKETQCIHSGSYRDSVTRGVTRPIFTSMVANHSLM